MSSFTVYLKEGNLRYTGEDVFFVIEETGNLTVKKLPNPSVPSGTIVPYGSYTPKTVAVFNKDYWTVVEYDDV